MAAEKELQDRLPPYNHEAEASVLGSMLKNNNIINDVVQIVHKDDFYTDNHQKIFETIVQLNDKGGQPVDLILLHEALQQRGYLEDAGGSHYLATLWDGVASSANVEYYAHIVREKALLRNLIRAGNEILGEAYKQTMPADEMVAAAERLILEVAQKGITGNLYTLDEAISETYDRIDKRMSGSELALSGLSTGFTDLDELTAGLQRSELVIIAARPSVGKCLTANSELVLSDGSITTIEEVFHRKSARLLTLHPDWKFRWAEPSAFVDDGVKPVFRVTTRLGRRVEATAAHPFLTLDGWRPLGELTIGEAVAVPRMVPVFGTQEMRECEIKLLGYLLGDGCLTDLCPEFINSNPRLRADFEEAIREFGGLKTRTETVGERTPTVCVSADARSADDSRKAFLQRLRLVVQARFTTTVEAARQLEVSPTLLSQWWQGKAAPLEPFIERLTALLGLPLAELLPEGFARTLGKNTLTFWLRELGLWNKGSREKFIPACVFRLPQPQVALFLNRLFATDGWATVLSGGNSQLGYCSVSEKLARQVQHLLLRFGIIAALRRREVKYREGHRVAWQIDVTDARAIATFASEIGIFGKEENLERVRSVAAGRKRYQSNRDLIPVGVWDRLDQGRKQLSWARVAVKAGLSNRTNRHVRTRRLTRDRLTRLAVAIEDAPLVQLASSEVYWDEIVSIEPLGPRQVYDLTIPDTHNFVANDVCVHNTAFSLSLARNIIVDEKAPVFFVSLEQSRIELAERMLCSQARVDSHRLRKGTLTGDDMQKLIEAGGVLRAAKLFIDDTPSQGMLRIAANARRLHRQHGIKLVVIDYLQLIEPDNRRDPRQEQVAQISRRLKFLARELVIPVVALAQVNRASEDRQDHRPRLSDLRESGCLAGETRITLADSGKQVPIRELCGRDGFTVWALDERTMKLKPAQVMNAFCTGRKAVFRLRTRLGRSIRATANHLFRTLGGWKRLDELKPGQHLALPRAIPSAKQESLACCGTTLFKQNVSRHRLDGCITSSLPVVYSVSPTRERGIASPSLARRANPANVRNEHLGRVVAALGGDEPLEALATSDVYWDQIASIESDGEDEVFDLTVPGPANFVANDIIAHNSIEQDADTVLMLHRPDRYEPGQHEGIIEVIIAKQRNGPTGEITLAYVKQHMRYEDFKVGTPFDG